ncbi:unnamed protein product [Rhodiola kirilowii]
MSAASIRETANFGKLKKFEGVNFRRWQKKMHFLLTSLKVVHVLSTPIPDADENGPLDAIRKKSKWENDDYICRGHILNGMADNLFDVYQNVESAKELWDALETKYMREDASSKKFLVSNFNSYKMVDSRPVPEQFNELTRILGQFAHYNMKMDDSIAVSSIIDKLPPLWKDFKHKLKHNKKEMSLEELGGELQTEESIRIQEEANKKDTIESSSVHMVEDKKSLRKFKGKKRANEHAGNKFNKKPKGSCWICGKPGHYKNDCRMAKNEKGKAKVNVEDKGKDKSPTKLQGQFSISDNNSSVNYVSLIAEAFYVQDDEVAWWIDSGANKHVCKDRRSFKTYETVKGAVLHMGNESTAPILGQGTVVLEFSSGKTLELLNVLYVPVIRKNLVFGSLLNKFGFKQVYESDKYVLSKCGVFVGFGYFCNGMFMLNVNKVVNSVYMSSTSDDFNLWHARLGHVHYQRLKLMSKEGLIPTVDMNVDKCNTCMLTKITRLSFKSISRTSNLLELVHSDMDDLHYTPSIGNKKYYITFIDDCSRYCYVYLLHAKDEALDKFKVYKAEVELMHDLIKRLRTDRGGEYYDPVYFQMNGIIHETTALYTPQQNGVAERKNRILKEMVNSMLSYSCLSNGFWGEAMLTACYLLNRVPNKRNNTTPYELWHKKKPNLNYLRVWGCRAVVRLPAPKIKSLGERGVDCIFIGYAEHSKAYRFYVTGTNDSISAHTVIESRDAIFDENRFSSIPRPQDLISSSTRAALEDDVGTSSEITSFEPRRSKRGRIEKSFGPDYQIYLIEGSRNDIEYQYSYCYHIDDDPRTYNEAMKSQDVSFWKEAINDEMDSIIGNNTWVLSDLPPGCKPLGCKWIFKKKMKVDGSVYKFKARLVIQGFRQKEGIDFFDTYAPVARISTIRLLIALAAINNLVVHQMDVKTAFLNGDLDEEIYMKQPE